MKLAISIIETFVLLACLTIYSLTRDSSFEKLFLGLAALVIPYSIIRMFCCPRKGAELEQFRFIVMIVLTLAFLFIVEVSTHGSLDNVIGDY